MIIQQLKNYLDKQRVSYRIITHKRSYTSQGTAAVLHVSGREFAKCVILRTGEGKMVMAVLPGPRHVNLNLAKKAVGAEYLELAKEKDFAPMFPGCEAGAEPPFGNLFSLPTYVDASLTADEEIIFNAGTHTETIRMRYADYERLVNTVVSTLSRAA